LTDLQVRGTVNSAMMKRTALFACALYRHCPDDRAVSPITYWVALIRRRGGWGVGYSRVAVLLYSGGRFVYNRIAEEDRPRRSRANRPCAFAPSASQRNFKKKPTRN